MILLLEYQDFTFKTAQYPDAGKGNLAALSYVALGLAGEAGEVANKVKKLLRDGDSDAKRLELLDELGDVAWYLARACSELGYGLDEVLAANMSKLLSRLARGTIAGSGDKR